MANILAAQTGNWSATSTWTGGVLPGAADIAVANSYTVTIDQDVTCLSVRTDATGGATATGGFVLSDGFTLTADVVAGGMTCIILSSGSAAIVGDVSGSATDASNYGTSHTGTGTLSITGNVTGGAAASAHGAYNSTTGTVTVTGDATGGSASNSCGMYANAAGIMSITGDVTGGSSSGAHGVRNNFTGTVTVTGDATGGSTSSAYGIYNANTGSVTLTGTVIAGAGPGVYNVTTGSCSVVSVTYGTIGQTPTFGRIKLATVAGSTANMLNTSATRTILRLPTATSVSAGSTVTIVRGDTMSTSITGLGDISSRTNLWVTLKASKGQKDSKALIQVDEDTGLLYIKGAAATAANGSITVDDATAGNITVAVTAAETAKLKDFTTGFYDVQIETATGITTLTTGTLAISQDVTRATG